MRTITENSPIEDGHGVTSRSRHHSGHNLAGSQPGLAVADGGYQLEIDDSTLTLGESAIRFRVIDAYGSTVRGFDTAHDKRMHLIVIRRDFFGFQHLHPEQTPDGGWTASARFEAAGVYGIYADFATQGRPLTLAANVFVAGAFVPLALPPVSRVADAGSGYEVTLDSTSPAAGVATPVRFTVTLVGGRVDRVEPYLGADGHLVALREHDQAFLHVHPDPGVGDGSLSFSIHYSTAGRYRLYLQFQHDGVVRTAAFTQVVAGPPELAGLA